MKNRFKKGSQKVRWLEKETSCFKNHSKTFWWKKASTIGTSNRTAKASLILNTTNNNPPRTVEKSKGTLKWMRKKLFLTEVQRKISLAA
jgi:hypothetical protein